MTLSILIVPVLLYYCLFRIQTAGYDYDSTGIESTLTAVQSGIELNMGPDYMNASNSTQVLLGLNQGLGTVFMSIQDQATPISFGNIDPVFVALDAFELAR